MVSSGLASLMITVATAASSSPFFSLLFCFAEQMCMLPSVKDRCRAMNRSTRISKFLCLKRPRSMFLNSASTLAELAMMLVLSEVRDHYPCPEWQVVYKPDYTGNDLREEVHIIMISISHGM